MRLRCSTLLQEKRVSALTVNSLHAEPKAAKTKIERFRRKWKAPSESARSFLKLPFGERGEMSKCAYAALKEKRVSALTVYFFIHVKTLHLRFDALCVCSRSELRLESKSA